MYVEFTSLPDSSNLWVYQSNRAFTTEEVAVINKKLEDFINNWRRHGDELNGSYLIKYNQFIVLAVDDATEVSGCSIDSSVNLMKTIEKEFSIDLLNKLSIAFKIGESINTVSLTDFKNYAKQNKIKKDTTVFNNLVITKKDFLNKWEVPAEKSWHQRFLV